MASKTILEAKLEADTIIRQAQDEAKKLYQDIISQEAAALSGDKQHRIDSARAEVCNAVLQAKQELIAQMVKQFKLEMQQESPETDSYIDKLQDEYKAELSRILFEE